MVKVWVAITAIVLAATGVNPTAQSPGRGSAPTATPAKPTPASTMTSLRISTRSEDGTVLSGVRLLLSGSGSGEFTTGAAGTAVVPNLKPGIYRVRCELEGYITLEREFTLGRGAWNPIDVVLTAAPPPPPPPPKAPPVAEAVPSGGAPVTLSVPDFLDRNFIGRDPLKESIVACKPLETVRLLQMREGVAQHRHDRADEIIYVVAGEGAVRIQTETTPIRAGALIVVPNGSDHAFEHRGKNPLIVVSTLSGSACEPAKTTP
jgi:hypothetical protein